ncbi:cell wall hydrolase [Parvularcula maris]|uniref:Cell wall hydrolase n=1 Tax=Parvularcula maris TaxID=2965077 RepID=A0A9X2L837_9PROT|nr:cell wall hydrolase [Parvularcula maris]MCQ8184835.1 cell wall hydrolase [Parvularcula maris]
MLRSLWLFAFALLAASCAGGSDAGREAARGGVAGAAPPAKPVSEAATASASAEPSDLDCMAMALYHEARGEGDAAMEAVAHVIRNRKDDDGFPSTVCGVVRQGGETPPCQFSFWCDGRSDVARNKRAYTRAEAAARRVLSGQSADPTEGALYFHAERVSPSWASSFRETHRSGGHIFLAE